MLAFNATFLFILLSFIIFTVALKQLFFDPLFGIKQAREDKKEADRVKSAACLAESSELSEHYANSLQDARRHSQAMVFEKRQQSKKDAASIMARAQQKASEQFEADMLQLRQWREETSHALESERQSLASQIYGMVLEPERKISMTTSSKGS
jgi:F-type H+-transporting ATPase subunit b